MLHYHIGFGVTLIPLSAATHDRRRFDNFMEPALGRQASDSVPSSWTIPLVIGTLHILPEWPQHIAVGLGSLLEALASLAEHSTTRFA